MRCSVRLQRFAFHLIQMAGLEQDVAHGHRQLEKDKMFSIIELQTRWIAKGKVGYSQELGLLVCVIEYEVQLILHNSIVWQGSVADNAVTIIEQIRSNLHTSEPTVLTAVCTRFGIKQTWCRYLITVRCRAKGNGLPSGFTRHRSRGLKLLVDNIWPLSRRSII